MSTKPHKGQIANWWKREFDRKATEAYYGEEAGLGFYILGTFLNHPQFGHRSGSSTSWIVKMGEPDADGNIEIETRNSRYTLVGPAVDTAEWRQRTGKLAD